MPLGTEPNSSRIPTRPQVQWGFPRFKEYCGDSFCTESGFVTFMIAEHAMIDKDAAWTEAMALPDKVPRAPLSVTDRVGMMWAG